MEILSLKKIEETVNKMSRKIAAPSNLLPTFGYNEDGARPEVKVDSSGYHYIIVERGEEREHLVTQDIDTLLYSVFDEVTSTMAFDYELYHRVEGRDCRRIAFDKQIQLLKLINSGFAHKRQEEIKRILAAHPFNDRLY